MQKRYGPTPPTDRDGFFYQVQAQLESNAQQISTLAQQVSRLGDIVEKLATSSAEHGTNIENLRYENSRLSKEISAINDRDRQRQNTGQNVVQGQLQQAQDRLFQGGISMTQMMNGAVWLVLGYLMYHVLAH